MFPGKSLWLENPDEACILAFGMIKAARGTDGNDRG